jgi:cardiolipin synthase
MPWSPEFNLPNLLTATRLVLTPFVAMAVANGDCRRALVLLAIAGSTDAADGFLARRYGWQTRTGAYLDPVADKLLLTSLYVCLGLSGFAPWWLIGVVVGRDLLILMMVGVALAFTTMRIFPPSIWGKVSTLVQIVGALALVSVCGFPGVVPAGLVAGIIWLIAVATAWSGLHYVVRGIGMLRNA